MKETLKMAVAQSLPTTSIVNKQISQFPYYPFIIHFWQFVGIYNISHNLFIAVNQYWHLPFLNPEWSKPVRALLRGVTLVRWKLLCGQWCSLPCEWVDSADTFAGLFVYTVALGYLVYWNIEWGHYKILKTYKGRDKHFRGKFYFVHYEIKPWYIV